MDKNPVGRPKSPLDLPDGWQETITKMYDNGASDVEIKAWIIKNRPSKTFSNDLWESWMSENKIFSETIKNGKTLSEAIWTREGRENLKDKDFNYTGWYMNMKNRFNWADRQKVDTTGEIIIVRETLD